MRVFVTRHVFPEVLEFLSGHFEVEGNQEDLMLNAEALAQRLADKDGVLAMGTDRIDAALIARAPKLRAACNCAVGFNNIDLAACNARGILATNTPGVLDDTTADQGFALLLAAARRLVPADRWVREGKWKRWVFADWLGSDVHHATLGIIGMGRIGRAVAKRAGGFSMRILYHNRTRLDESLERECAATYASKEQLLAESDFVMLTLPYSPEAHHLIGAKDLALMKPTAILVNIARGGIVDDAALIDALKAGRIGGAGLDVFENEPQLNPGFLELDNAVLAPHIGSASRGTRMKMAMLAATNLVAALTTGDPPNLLNPEAKARRA